jgi:trimeric autotransporter adhesin
MKKFLLLFCYLLFITLHQLCAQTSAVESRMNEVFQVTELTHASPNTRFYDPWEVTYGPDDSLWITEAKNYKVYKMSPNGSTPRMILNISPGSPFLPSAFRFFNLTFPAAESTFLDGGFTKSATAGNNSAPQGGLAGLAIHPKFLSGSPYVFVSYVWKFVKNLSTANQTIKPNAGNTDTVITTTTGTPANGGVYYQNALIRFTYDFTSGTLGNPMTVCDTLPGSSDHNSQRIIIAPINGTYYLFYANGDMGAGQFGNSARVENAQNLDSYEGKILRFNVDPDGDADTIDRWIPNTNPFNNVIHAGVQSAVWAFGFRNNQGFAYARINNTDYLYGQMHGPFSDDEINVIHGSGNYGHPLVVGYKRDGNYNNAGAGNPYTSWTGTYAGIKGGLPLILDENHNADSMNQFHTYYDPIYTYFPAAVGSSLSTDLTKNTAVPSEMQSMQYMYYWFNKGQQSNTYWPSEAPSGMDVYTNSMIPGWKNSLLSAVMKGAPNNFTSWNVVTSGGNKGAPSGPSTSTGAAGKIMRLKLNTNGDALAISPTNAIDSSLKAASAYADDTVSYFAAQNRFRDLAISKDGLSFYTIIDSSSTTSGPTATNPANSLCKGCLIKYTFLGYKDNGTTSTLPDTIPVATGTYNTCVNANTVTINSANNNNNIWVPITDTNSNIIAEINANGNNLGTVTTSYYLNSSAVREAASHVLYLDRNLTITPQTQPTTNVKIRLYITSAELTALEAAHNSLGAASQVTSVSSLAIFKNQDGCSNSFGNVISTKYAPTPFTRTSTGGGYALQATIPSFSTFYFAGVTTTLAMNLLSFTGHISNNVTQLQWITENESDTKGFTVERSTDGNQFDSIGIVGANDVEGRFTYYFNDASIQQLTCPYVYYRLKIVNNDMQYKYSNVVKLPLSSFAGSLNVHPNPTTNTTTVEINATADDNAKWNLIDNTGATVMHGSIQLKQGNNAFDINMGQLPPGMYYLRLSGNYINQGTKISKL